MGKQGRECLTKWLISTPVVPPKPHSLPITHLESKPATQNISLLPNSFPQPHTKPLTYLAGMPPPIFSIFFTDDLLPKGLSFINILPTPLAQEGFIHHKEIPHTQSSFPFLQTNHSEKEGDQPFLLQRGKGNIYLLNSTPLL